MKTQTFVFVTVAFTWVGCSAGVKLDTRTFETHHLPAEAVSAMIEPYVYYDRPGAQGAVSVSGNMLTVRETPDNLEKIGRVLEMYDVPRPSVRLRFQVIEADGTSGTDPEISEVEAQLRELFRFEGYRLVAQAVIWATENSEVAQEFGPQDDPYSIHLEIMNVRGTVDSGTVRLHVSFSPSNGGLLATTVNARTGQTVVLGNAQLRRGRGTLILALKPELVPM